nr:hypothetical protein [Pseudomonas sp. RIT-PI-S]
MMIAAMVIAGVAILIAIGFLNNAVEANKAEKIRLGHELKDRLRRCAEINERFPGQFTTPELKMLMHRLEHNVVKRALALDKSNVDLKERLAELELDMNSGKGDGEEDGEKGKEKVEVKNPATPIVTEAQAKEVSFLIEALHHQILRAAQEGIFKPGESRHWANVIRGLLVQLHLEYFNNLGQQAFQDADPGHARLAYERAVQYLKKQPDPAVYSEQLAYAQKMVARADALVLNKIQANDGDENELTAGLKETEDETQWKKKAIYD